MEIPIYYKLWSVAISNSASRPAVQLIAAVMLRLHELTISVRQYHC